MHDVWWHRWDSNPEPADYLSGPSGGRLIRPLLYRLSYGAMEGTVKGGADARDLRRKIFEEMQNGA